MMIQRAVAMLMAGRPVSCTGNWKNYTIECNDGLPIPTLEELKAAGEELKADKEANKYKRQRSNKYPSQEEMMEALWEMLVESRPEKAMKLNLRRQEVKAMFPKPAK